ncbi:uncharacterized protein UHO2_00827 [Ustilago hordei]|uniref:Uncharacterized protein n=1 Tax=Ustilago hordei TaxID=120017 RepID=I2FM59_USTHO|nr:uncharacterized protein UHO2_00827 [Ustilago hordei]CCF48002.1 uncharacterized protein UHOR_12516 [Ustilago hordei]SYW73962.1 uncharacterized protein UHO2_00827 [Ustilago hordei]
MFNHPLVTISPSALAPTPMPSTNQALLAAQPPFAPTQPSGDKLCNPANAPTSQSAELGVLVNGVHVTIPEPVAVASSSKVFLCLLPDICSFAQAWVVYTLLRCTCTNNPHLSTSLGAFLVHVINLDITFHWPGVTEYILAVCHCHFGFANTCDWPQLPPPSCPQVPKDPAPTLQEALPLEAQPAPPPDAGSSLAQRDCLGSSLLLGAAPAAGPLRLLKQTQFSSPAPTITSPQQTKAWHGSSTQVSAADSSSAPLLIPAADSGSAPNLTL